MTSWQIFPENKNECPDSFVPIRLNSNRSIHLLPFYPSVFMFKTDGTARRTPVLAAAGGFHSLLLMNDGTLFTWGDNQYGQLGLGDRRKRLAPTHVIFFAARPSSPFFGPLDGVGRSINTRPDPIALSARPVVTIAAGEHHSLIAADCAGGGFLDDGSCNCRFGWKGPDCSLECKGGANHSCSKRGTFDRVNTIGDREMCRAYLTKIGQTRCVGLKTASTAAANSVRAIMYLSRIFNNFLLR